MPNTPCEGVIRADESYSKAMVLRILRIAQKSWDKMLDEGLPTTSLGHSKWVSGKDLMDHLQQRAERKHQSSNQNS